MRHSIITISSSVNSYNSYTSLSIFHSNPLVSAFGFPCFSVNICSTRNLICVMLGWLEGVMCGIWSLPIESQVRLKPEDHRLEALFRIHQSRIFEFHTLEIYLKFSPVIRKQVLFKKISGPTILIFISCPVSAHTIFSFSNSL